jgi:hypothetical protein
MIDTYEIAKNLALTGALGYSNKDASAMLKLVSQLPPRMDELIRAERGRFAAMPKALGGITGCGALFRVPSVLDKMPKDLFPSHVAATNYARDRQHDWNVVPPPPAPIKVDVTINLKSRPSETS